MSSLHFNIRMFARTPSAAAADFDKSEWLDLAICNKFGGQRLDRLGWLDLEKNSRVCTPVGGANPVAQVIARPIAASFPLFGKLVVEIQNKIWKMVSLNYFRIITMIEEDVDVTLHPNDDEYTVIGASDHSFSTLARGALSAMVGIYQPMFQLNPSHYHGNKRGVFINPEIDVIHFISLRSFRGEAPPMNYIGGLKNCEEFGMIQHICLPIHDFHENLQKLAQVVRRLPLLESVMVMAHAVDLTIPHTFHMDFMIQDVQFSRPDRRPRSDMQIHVMDGRIPLFGAAATELLFSRIGSLNHKAEIMEGLGRVEIMMRQEQNFPNRVFARFIYRNHQ